MRPQESCLEGEPGAGAKYMNEFDQLPTSIRDRIRESPYNLCVACLYMRANAPTIPNFFAAIEIMEQEITHGPTNLRSQNRREPEDRLRSIYDPAYDPYAYEYDPCRPAPGSYGNPASRSLYDRVEWGFDRARDYDARRDYQSRQAEYLKYIELTRQPIISPELYKVWIK